MTWNCDGWLAWYDSEDMGWDVHRRRGGIDDHLDFFWKSRGHTGLLRRDDLDTGKALEHPT